MELRQFEVHILQSLEKRLSQALDYLVCQSMSKNLARLLNRSFNASLILARLCGVLWNVHTHCSNGKSFKENYLLGSPYPLLLIQKYHTRRPYAKHKERQVSGSSHRGKWFSEDGLGNPGSPWFPLEVWEVKTIFTNSLRHYLICSLSFSLKCMVEITRRHMTWNMATDWMHKQIRGFNHLSLSWTLKKFAAK